MATPIEMPKSGNTVDACVISRWVKRKGDRVDAGAVIAEIETDKASFEVTTPVGGMVLETFFEEGALVPVFTTICIVGEAGERVTDVASASGERTVDSRTDQAVAERRAHSLVAPLPGPLPTGRCAASASPRALKVAAGRGVDLASIAGSGPGGRILERDVLAQSTALAAESPLSLTRRTIARRLRESLASTAQYTLNASADAAGLLAARARFKSGGTNHITITHLVTLCTIRALVDMPELNAELIDGALVSHSAVHIGFACDTPRGLLVPVVRDAHTLRIGDLATQMRGLEAEAMAGTISPDRMTGATFTISNLGAFGVESFTPVINLPQVAILGVGAIQLKPVRVDDRVEFVDAIGLSLTCDHQAIDGAPAARFLRVLTHKIEQVDADLIMRGS